MSLDLVVEYIYNNCITLKSDSFLKGITFEPRSDFFFEKESLFGQKVIIFWRVPGALGRSLSYTLLQSVIQESQDNWEQENYTSSIQWNFIQK